MAGSTATLIRLTLIGIRPVLLAVVPAWATLGAPPAVAYEAPRPVLTSEAGVLRPEDTAGPLPLAAPHPEYQSRRADFRGEAASREARLIADWVTAAGDNGEMPFVVIDKVHAKVFVFDPVGRLRGAAPALLGIARGDDTVPGIGDRKLSSIRLEERTTPAGRFIAVLGRDLHEDILWIDYGSSLSLHRVVNGTAGDQRLQRLATETPVDNRISYGCVNVPIQFYEDFIRPAFTDTSGVVYILPEVKKIESVFPVLASSAGFRKNIGH